MIDKLKRVASLVVRASPEFVFFTRRRGRRVAIYQSYYRREERFNLSIIYRRFASRQRFPFFTRRRRRSVSNYQSYYGREETKYNRSEWCTGRALARSALCDNMIDNLNADLCFEIVLTFQRLTTTPLRPVVFSSSLR